MKKIYLLLGLVSSLTFAQQEYSNLKIKAWSPTLYLQRNTNEGGFTQGIQTQLSDETNNWFFGAFGTGSWIVSKVDHDNIKFLVNENGNVGIGTLHPDERLSVEGGIGISRSSNEGAYLSLVNPQKTGDYATIWRVYNMTGYYGNSLQFWSYTNDWRGGSKFILSDNGNAVLHGKLEAKEIKVTETPTADFVFEEDYVLPTLKEVEQHIKEKKHLPEIASAKQMEKEGVNIGEFQIQLLQKIEELTLYIIEQNKELLKQREEIKQLKSK